MILNAAIDVAEGALRRTLAGSSERRLAELYAAHASAAARLAYLITGDRDAAEDIAHEAFVRLGGRLLLLRDQEGAPGYLYRTVANLARGHGRRLKRERDLRLRLEIANTGTPPDLESKDEVWRSLLELPVRQRTALFLRYYLDLPEAQAAEILNCSTSAMKSLTHRAAESLRKHLQGAR